MNNILSAVLVEMASLNLSVESENQIFSDVFNAMKIMQEDKNGTMKNTIIWWLNEAQRTIAKHDLVEYHDALVAEIDSLKVEITKLYENC